MKSPDRDRQPGGAERPRHNPATKDGNSLRPVLTGRHIFPGDLPACDRSRVGRIRKLAYRFVPLRSATLRCSIIDCRRAKWEARLNGVHEIGWVRWRGGANRT